jgi:hypothetical protein
MLPKKLMNLSRTIQDKEREEVDNTMFGKKKKTTNYCKVGNRNQHFSLTLHNLAIN